MIEGALNDVGGRKYLARQAIETPQAFLTLVGKVLPREIIGDPSKPVILSVEDLNAQQEQALAALDRAFRRVQAGELPRPRTIEHKMAQVSEAIVTEAVEDEDENDEPTPA